MRGTYILHITAIETNCRVMYVHSPEYTSTDDRNATKQNRLPMNKNHASKDHPRSLRSGSNRSYYVII